MLNIYDVIVTSCLCEDGNLIIDSPLIKPVRCDCPLREVLLKAFVSYIKSKWLVEVITKLWSIKFLEREKWGK